jgi:hypothetical protein
LEQKGNGCTENNVIPERRAADLGRQPDVMLELASTGKAGGRRRTRLSSDKIILEVRNESWLDRAGEDGIGNGGEPAEGWT